MRIAILHYSGPPVVGGVEQTIFYHALTLARAGHQVTVCAGAGEPFAPGVDVRIVPEAGSRHPEVAAMQAELARG
ncbi:MAG TPA: hypothetical protein VGA61_10135, partial [Anaerolineae bacterium]